jgi:hypothetical protein
MHYLLLLLIIAVPSYACPNLSGNYPLCRSLSEQQEYQRNLSIEQKTANKITQYTFNYIDEDEDEVAEIYKADGKTKVEIQKDPDTGVILRSETTASCQGDELLLKFRVKLDNTDFAKLQVRVFKKNNKLHQLTKGESMGEEINDEVVCE